MTGKIVDDRYEILKSLGKGGMGEVYLAQHIKLEQFRVVLKEQVGILPGQEQQALDEANNLAKVSTGCRHVCRIVDFFTDAGKAWLVMDHVEGSNIADLISKEGKLTFYPEGVRDVLKKLEDERPKETESEDGEEE